jgi:hypothetical protein
VGLGRFLNKRIWFCEGIAKSANDEAPAVFFEDGKTKVVGAAAVEGDITATGVTLNSASVKGATSLTHMWSLVATIDLAAAAGIYGSTNGFAEQDVAVSGAAIGDIILVRPVASLGHDYLVSALCLTAGAITVRSTVVGTVGAKTPGNTPFRITSIRI